VPSSKREVPSTKDDARSARFSSSHIQDIVPHIPRQLTIADIITNAFDKHSSVDQAVTDFGDLMNELELFNSDHVFKHLDRLNTA
jgi:hypothetical protein